MKLNRFSIGTLGLIAVSGLAWSCSSKSDDCNANLNCGPYGGGALGTSGAAGASGTSGRAGAESGTSGASGNSGTNGEGGADIAAGTGGAPPPTCDGSLSPDADACVISDQYGLFVSPTGDDSSADGTQAHPFATLTSALLHVDTGKHVYVCAADYIEPAEIEIPDRVAIYGGFTCADGNWNYDTRLRAHVLPQSPIGAMITEAKVGVLIQDLRLDAGDATEDGASSFGLVISGSKNISLKRVEIRAGKGGKGSTGVDGAPIPDSIPSGDAQKGKAAECGTSTNKLYGGMSVGVQCTSEGGAGGDGIKGSQSQSTSDRDGKTGFPGPPNGIIASQTPNLSGGEGKEGAAGLPGILGAAAPAMGMFKAGGYVVASGGDGTSGQPGQGGGGGASSFAPAACVGASGGAGGMGGCGGPPGTGGGGGGASVAVLSWDSSVTIDTCILAARDGGAGGNGGKGRGGGVGQEGGKGGAGNTDNQVGLGGKGGTGGSGGNGGSGAGGTGGPSIALVWNGTPPALTNPTLKFSDKPAPGGAGAQLGLDPKNKAPDGMSGATQDVHPKL